jgi:16S rRNA (guanine527-N7)-methyltransferase
VTPPAAPQAEPALLTRLEPMLALLAEAPASLSSVTDPDDARNVHLRDSLSGLALPEVRNADLVADIGAGAGFPGIPLAAALPSTRFDLLDSVGRKVDFMNEVVETLGLDNVRAIKTRSEDLASGEGRERYGLATARAVAPLTVLAELASPLLREGGSLVAWKGARETGEEELLAGLRARLAMELERFVEVEPFTGSRVRHLYVIRKIGATPSGLPRRPGMARKRPLTL